MKRKLFGILALMGGLSFTFAQDACNFGTVSDQTGLGENIATGGSFEYLGAADFTVPFGTTFTANQVTVNILKGTTDLGYLNVAILSENGGVPGTVIESFDNLSPTSQQVVYNVEGENFSVYTLTIDLPEPVVLEKGTYFLQLAANPGDENGAWWEITAQEQTYGNFDYMQFENEPWGGAGYYSKVFKVVGTCAPSGEEHPDFGDECMQSNTSETHETGIPFISQGGLLTIADDFIVAENTTFYLTHFTMSSLLLGGGLDNATINIRNSDNGAPGEILHTFTNKGPAYEKYNGYWPFPGVPLDVASIVIQFSFDHEPIELAAGTYFIDVTPTPNSTEFLTWEATSGSGIGGYSYISGDGGNNWSINEGFNQIFTIEGFCTESLGTDDPALNQVGIYPNPAKDILQIRSAQPVESVALFDVNGREIREYQNPSETLDVSDLSNGLYLARIVLSNGATSNLKIVKE